MRAHVLSRAAENDLAQIAAHTIEAFGAEQAVAYRDGLISTFRFLSENPRVARLRDELSPPMRAHRYQSHLVFYDVEPDGSILIVRIRHVREDWFSDGGA